MAASIRRLRRLGRRLAMSARKGTSGPASNPSAMPRLLALLVFGFLCCNLGFADGKFLSIRGTVSKPEIPYQRALISYRNGTETMIVESVLNALPGDYA